MNRLLIIAVLLLMPCQTLAGCLISDSQGAPIVLAKPETVLHDVCKTGYHSRFREDTKTPFWVVSSTSKKWISETGTRRCVFHPEPALPQGISPTKKDYEKARDRSGNVLAAGHHIPAADFYGDPKVQQESCSFANIFPQVQKTNNAGVWSAIENWVRKSTFRYGTQHVLVTSSYPKNPDRVGLVAIPSTLFKAVCDPSMGRVIFFEVPNQPLPGKKPNDFVITRSDFVARTGLNPFPKANCGMEATKIW